MNAYQELGFLSREVRNIPSDFVRVSFFIPIPFDTLYEKKIKRFFGEDNFAGRIVGTSYFRPLPGAHPTSGEVGVLSHISEALLSFNCPPRALPGVEKFLEEKHPHETFVAEIETQSDNSTSSWRLRAHVKSQRIIEAMEAFAEQGVGVIGNYDMCFFAYQLQDEIWSIETVVSGKEKLDAAEVANSLRLKYFFDPLKDSKELHGQRSELDRG